MSEDTALVVREQAQPMTLQETMTLGDTLFKSGYFTDAKSAAQAVVKILAGRELGFGPIASMTGLYVQGGRVCLSANLIAAQVKNSGRYGYRIVELTNEQCEIAFYEGGQEMNPRSVFTMQDAKTAGLTNGKNSHSWSHYPRNMLFARAISNGVRWHCPELFSGSSVYTPEEMDLVVDGETGNVIDVTPKPAQKQAKSAQGATSQASAASDNGGDKPHWIDRTSKAGKPIRAAFWAWAKDTLALSDEQVYQALGVDHVHDYAGTMDEAKAQIEAWVGDQLKQQVPA
jgi:hypothetical protein